MSLLALRILLAALLGIALAGCMVGPDYIRPATNSSVVWNAPRPHGASVSSVNSWWSRFDDPAVAQLVALAEGDSPTLTQAWAAIERARATLKSTKAGLLPSASAGASATRSHQGDTAVDAANSVSSSRNAAADASWELDLFGKVRRGRQAAEARVDARVDDWHDARVSLAAEVADTYVQYRSCELLIAVYESELASIEATDKATTDMVRAGFTAPA